MPARTPADGPNATRTPPPARATDPAGARAATQPTAERHAATRQADTLDATAARPGRTRASGRRWPASVSRWIACALVGVALGVCLPLAAHAADVGWLYLASHARGRAMPSDFLNYYTAGRALLEGQPAVLYDPDREAALQRVITARDDVYSQFQNLPQAALPFVPLAAVPYTAAYLAFAALNLALLVAAAWLLAPRRPRWLAWPVWVIGALAAFGPLQFALIDGQTTLLGLFGASLWLAALARQQTADARARAGWLSTWALKPQLLPLPLLALGLARAWRAAVLVLGVQVLALLAVVAWAGPDLLARYVKLTRSAAQVDGAGQTLLGLAQQIDLGGPLASAVGLLGDVAVGIAVLMMWRGGLRPDRRRLLQLAVLPVAAVLVSVRAYAYEMTLWLPSAWLITRYLLESRQASRHAVPVLVGALSVAWLCATLTLLNGGAGVPWGAPGGVVLLVALLAEYRATGNA